MLGSQIGHPTHEIKNVASAVLSNELISASSIRVAFLEIEVVFLAETTRNEKK
jgi:hypothetical protein